MVAATDETRCGPESEAIDPQTGIVQRKKIILSCQSVVFHSLKTKIIGKLNRDKHLSVSYIGNTLHKSVPECKAVTFSDKIKVNLIDNLFFQFSDLFIRALHVISNLSNLLYVKRCVSLNSHILEENVNLICSQDS